MQTDRIFDFDRTQPGPGPTEITEAAGEEDRNLCRRGQDLKPPRTQKRADSRAHTACPICKKKLHGEKGLKAHMAEAHRG